MTTKSKLKFDCIVIGAGVGGAVAANRLAKSGLQVMLLDAGSGFDKTKSVATSIFSHYWNGGIVPLFGPFTCPFGQAKVLGGGTVINGALIWPLPEEVRNDWARLIPGSVFASDTWKKIQDEIFKEFSVNDQHSSYLQGNYASKLLHSVAEKRKLQILPVPRATSNCQNFNRCGSGCIVDAKNTASSVLLSGQTNITISSKSFAYKIQRENDEWLVKFSVDKHKKIAQAPRVILSSGATESAILLRKSNLSKKAGSTFKFHLNFKVLAKFDKPIDPRNGTILTHQIQEYMTEGILMMSSNFRMSYLASSLSHLMPKHFKEYINNYNKMGIYTVMIRPNVKASVNGFMGQTYGFWQWDQESFERTKRGIKLLAELLFDAGARDVILPIKNKMPVVFEKYELRKVLKELKQEELIGVSVHGMSACRMGTSSESSVVDTNGQVWGHEGLYVMDSSILPDNIGESPQGTILTVVDMLIRKWF
jgi:choline dehydrogenase-like flavoprotein